MDGKRLDQLKFPDETKVGLALLMAYMLVDVTQSFTFGGWYAASLIDLPQNGRNVGWLQLGMLVTLLVGYATWRRHKVRTLLGLRDLASADAALADDANYLARHIARGRGRFFVTSNFNDCNAFCMPAGNEKWIVLGAGLRVLFLKQRERVRAVLAHECAHVHSGDVGYVVIAWYMFCAYMALAVVHLLLSQGRFWFHVPEVLPEYEQVGGIWGLVRYSLPELFANGFAGLLPIVGLWFVQRHLIQLREFRADERAAQYGFRSTLVETINTLQRNAAGLPLMRALTLHPAARQRMERLTSQQPWVRLDHWFMGAMAFLAARIQQLVPNWVMEGPKLDADTVDEAMTHFGVVVESSGLALLGSLIFELAIALMLLLHIYRVAVTQAALGATWLHRSALVWSACVATFAGTFLGEATSWRQLARLADRTAPWTLTNALDSSLLSAGLAFMATWFLAMAIVAMSRGPLRRPPRNWWGQALRMIASTLLVAAVIQMAASVIAVGVGNLFGEFPAWEIDGLPITTRPLVPGIPSLLQVTLLTLVLSLLLALPRKYQRRRAAPTSLADPNWYALA